MVAPAPLVAASFHRKQRAAESAKVGGPDGGSSCTCVLAAAGAVAVRDPPTIPSSTLDASFNNPKPRACFQVPNAPGEGGERHGERLDRREVIRRATVVLRPMPAINGHRACAGANSCAHSAAEEAGALHETMREAMREAVREEVAKVHSQLTDMESRLEEIQSQSQARHRRHRIAKQNGSTTNNSALPGSANGSSMNGSSANGGGTNGGGAIGTTSTRSRRKGSCEMWESGSFNGPYVEAPPRQTRIAGGCRVLEGQATAETPPTVMPTAMAPACAASESVGGASALTEMAAFLCDSTMVDEQHVDWLSAADPSSMDRLSC